MRQFQEAATTDHKTGVLNSGGLARRRRPGLDGAPSSAC